MSEQTKPEAGKAPVCECPKQKALEMLAAFMRTSDGIVGYHLNGAVAPWSEVDADGEVDAALSAPCPCAELPISGIDGGSHEAEARDRIAVIGFAETERRIASLRAELATVVDNLAAALFPDSPPDSARAEFMLDAAGACRVIKRLRVELATARKQIADDAVTLEYRSAVIETQNQRARRDESIIANLRARIETLESALNTLPLDAFDRPPEEIDASEFVDHSAAFLKAMDMSRASIKEGK